MSRLEAALDYARRGFAVLPVGANKAPLTAHGYKDATTDESQIRIWWAIHPDANVGIATGAVSGFDVLDIDKDKGGFASLEAIEAEYGPLPKTPRAKTGGGGSHFCFAHPGVKVSNRVGMYPGVDVRGDGGLIVVAPSIHASGAVYEWELGLALGEVELAPLPAFLMPKEKPVKDAPASKAKPKVSADEKLRRRAEKYLNKVAPVGQGERNHAAFCISGHLRSIRDEAGAVLSEDTILELTRRWNAFNSPPLDDVELAKCVQSSAVNGTPRAPKPPNSPPAPSGSGAPPPPPSYRKPRASLNYNKGELHALAAQTMDVVAKVEPPVAYQWAGSLARTIEVPDPQHLVSGRTLTRPHMLSADALAHIMTEYVAYTKLVMDKATGKWLTVPTDCPMAMVRMVAARGEWPKVRRLSGIRESYTLLPSGRLITQPGYDPDSGYFSAFDPTQFPLPPEKPSKDDALKALQELDLTLLAGFPFVADSDRSAALASIITGVARTAVPTAPGFMSTSPTRSSGKSTLAALPSNVALGREPTSLALGENEEETEKRVFAALLEGRQFISIDNRDQDLDSVAVSRAITETTFAGRLLGSSRIGEVLTTGTTWTSSGVNVIPKRDMASRMITIHLDPKCERPWERKFENPDPRVVALEQRGRWIALCLTVLRAYMLEGCPDVGLDGYRLKEWSKLIRGALVWLGYADPLAGMREVEADDPERLLLRELIEGWHQAIGEEAVTVESLRKRAEGSDALSGAILAVAVVRGEYEPRRIGNFLRRCEGNVVDGRRFERAGTEGHAIRWALRSVEGGVSGVSGVSLELNAWKSRGTPTHIEGRLELLTPETPLTPLAPRPGGPPRPVGPPVSGAVFEDKRRADGPPKPVGPAIDPTPFASRRTSEMFDAREDPA